MVSSPLDLEPQMDSAIQSLLDLLDQAFVGPAWHGPTLSNAVRGFSADQAAWRPGPGRHSAWEIALHCAYWEHRVHERLAPGTAAPFPRTRSNWPDLPKEITTAGWKADLALLESVHNGLRATVAALPPASLGRPGPGQKKTRLENIIGICYHDIYHAGQIRLLHRIQRSEAPDRGRLRDRPPKDESAARSPSRSEDASAPPRPIIIGQDTGPTGRSIRR
jgi:hypothetical protein